LLSVSSKTNNNAAWRLVILLMSRVPRGISSTLAKGTSLTRASLVVLVTGAWLLGGLVSEMVQEKGGRSRIRSRI